MSLLKTVASIFQPKKDILRSDEEQARVNKECEKFKLYQFQSCPFCVKVRLAMKRLNLNIELRDIKLNQEWERELISHGGARQVPCLKIEDTNGQVRWLYESDNIIQFLTEKYAK